MTIHNLPAVRALNRRAFIGAAAAAAAAPLVPLGAIGSARSKRVLVLGGTNFVGPAVVQHALDRGHEVTLFNRGITRPDLFSQLERLRGTRGIEESDLRALAGGRRWDAVIDVWPEHRRIVDETTALLRDRADYYFYVSSIAVYRRFDTPGMTESAPVRGGTGYGAEKAAAEALVAERFAGRYGVARCPGIVGPLDPGASYHFWLRRLATAEEVLCPGSGNDPVQIVDVRDVGRWAVACAESGRSGTFNLTGPWPPRTLRELLQRTAAALGSAARRTWVDADFLRREHGVRSFSDLPLWAPLDEDAGFYQIDGSAALQAGAVYRPIEETAADTWRYYRSYYFKDIRFPYQGSGLAGAREAELLRAWHARSSG